MDISGDVCKATGIYRCNVHHENLICMKMGNRFPECAHGSYGKHNTLWNPARNVKAIMADLKAESIESAYPKLQ